MSPHDDTDLPAYKTHLHAAATSALSLVGPTIHEIELVLSRLTPRVISPTHTGLPSFIKDFQREGRSIQRAVQDVDGTPKKDEEKEWERVKKISAKINASATAIEQTILLWSVLKRCRSLRAVNQTFQSSTREMRREAIAKNEASAEATSQGRDRAQMHRELKEKARVDVQVVERGFEWLDLRPVNLDRLGRQMTDAGWGWGEHELGDAVDEDEWEGALLARQVRKLADAASMNRHEYRIPRVRVVLPNVRRGVNEDVDVFLEQLERTHPHVQVTIEDGGSEFLQGEPPDIEQAVENLVGSEWEDLTDVINLDHTILIDLISDITHSKLEPQPWQAKTTQSQIEEENESPGGVMAKALYPTLRGRKLICTKEAAEHFHEVLQTVGTTTERQRGHILIPDPASPSPLAVSASEASNAPRLHERFSALSIHPPPQDFQVPVTILPNPIDFEGAVRDGRLPRVALDVARCGGFKSAKLSIYMHGWMEDIVTVTSNKEIRGHIRTWIEANRRPGEEAALGPRIYRFDMTRNLLAKSATPPDGWEGVSQGAGSEA